MSGEKRLPDKGGHGHPQLRRLQQGGVGAAGGTQGSGQPLALKKLGSQWRSRQDTLDQDTRGGQDMQGAVRALQQAAFILPVMHVVY